MTGCTESVRRYLGLALIPQAGVSIGLAVLAQRILPESSGSLLSTIILSSSVLYEMIGPVCARKALILSGSIKTDHSTGKPSKPAGKSSKREKKPCKSPSVPAARFASPTPRAATQHNGTDIKWNESSQRLWPVRREHS